MAASRNSPILVFPPDSDFDEFEDEHVEVPAEPEPKPKPPRVRRRPRPFELLFDAVFMAFALAIVFAFPGHVLQDEAGLHLAAGERILERWRPATHAPPAGVLAAGEDEGAAALADGVSAGADEPVALTAAHGEPAGGMGASAAQAAPGVRPLSDDSAYGSLPPGWLGQLALAAAHRAGGLSAVIILVALLLALCYGFLAVFLQGRGVHPLFAAGMVLIAAILGSSQWAAGPTIFMYLGSAALLLLLDRRRYTALIGVAILFGLWANLGSGIWFGLGLLALVLAGDLAETRWGDAPAAWRARAWFHAAALGVALLATLANPAGWGLLEQVLNQSPALFAFGAEVALAHGASMLQVALFIAIVGAILGTLALRSERLPFPTLLVLLATLALALTAPGFAAVFALVAVPLFLAAVLGTPEVSEGSPSPPRRDPRRRPEDEFPQGWLATAVAVLLILLAGAGGNFAGFQIVRDSFDPERFPVEAVAAARDGAVTASVCGPPRWNGYLAYAWPAAGNVYAPGDQSVSSSAPRRAECRELASPPVAAGAALVLLPAEDLYANDVSSEGGWRILHRDPVAVLFGHAELHAWPERTTDDSQ